VELLKWQFGDELDRRVVKRDGWLDLIDIEAPNQQGVFVFVSEVMEVKYVGCTHESLNEEIKSAIAKGKSSGSSMFSWYITDTKSDAESLKAYWIKKYEPGNN